MSMMGSVANLMFIIVRIWVLPFKSVFVNLFQLGLHFLDFIVGRQVAVVYVIVVPGETDEVAGAVDVRLAQLVAAYLRLHESVSLPTGGTP